MRDDDIKAIVRADKAYATLCQTKHGGIRREKDQKVSNVHRVSQADRTLGRLIGEARKNNQISIISLDSLLSPDNFDIVVSCAKPMSYKKQDSALKFKSGGVLKLVGF